MNYDLKISAHVALGDELTPAHSGKIESLNIKVKDDPKEGRMPLEEICEFIGMCYKPTVEHLIKDPLKKGQPPNKGYPIGLLPIAIVHFNL